MSFEKWLIPGLEKGKYEVNHKSPVAESKYSKIDDNMPKNVEASLKKLPLAN